MKITGHQKMTDFPMEALTTYRSQLTSSLELLKERLTELKRIENEVPTNIETRESGFLASASKGSEQTRRIKRVVPHQIDVVELHIALQERKIVAYDSAVSSLGSSGNEEHDVLADVINMVKGDPEHMKLESALRKSQTKLNQAEAEHSNWIKATVKVAAYKGRRFAELDVLRDSMRKAISSTKVHTFLDDVLSDPQSKEAVLVSKFLSGVYSNDSFPIEQAPGFIINVAEAIVKKYPGRMIEDYETLENATRSVEMALENHIYPQLYKRAFKVFKDEAADLAISNKCKEYTSITQQQLNVDEDFITDDIVPFATPIAILKTSLYLAMSPSRKLFALLDAAHAILSYSTETKLMGGDTFIDIWIYCIIHANPPNLQTTINYIEHFAIDSMLQAELGYYFSSLQVACSFIRDLTDEKLNTSVLIDRKKFVVGEPERFYSWSNRDSHIEIVSRTTLIGYRLWSVLDWIFDPSKLRATLLEYTGDDNDTVAGIVMTTNRTTTEPQYKFLDMHFFSATEPYSRVVDSNDGTLIASTIDDIPQTSAVTPCLPDFSSHPLSLVRIPDGDYDNYVMSIKLRLSLLRLGCNSSDSSFLAPSVDLLRQFVDKYHVDLDTNDLDSIDHALNRIVLRIQVCLRHLGHYPILMQPDGVIGNLTVGAITTAQRSFLSMPCDVQGVMTYDGMMWLEKMVYSVQNDLFVLGYELGEGVDPCEHTGDPLSNSGMKAFTALIAEFQKNHGLSFPDGVAGPKTRNLMSSLKVPLPDNDGEGGLLIVV